MMAPFPPGRGDEERLDKLVGGERILCSGLLVGEVVFEIPWIGVEGFLWSGLLEGAGGRLVGLGGRDATLAVKQMK